MTLGRWLPHSLVAKIVSHSLVAKIVSSYVRKKQLAPADMPALITTVRRSLLSLGKPIEPEPNRTPAVPIRRSVTPDSVISLECGW
jgi:predicted transcriptional regulator